MVLYNDALRRGKTQSNTKIQGVASAREPDSGSMKVMVFPSQEEVKESQPTDYGYSALRII